MNKPDIAIFIFGVCIIAGIARTIRRWIKIDHTVVLFAVGLLLGNFLKGTSAKNNYFTVSFLQNLQPLALYPLFLYVAIFEIILTMDSRTFKSSTPRQFGVLVLGYVIWLLCQGIFVFFFLSVHSMPVDGHFIVVSILFGSFSAACDPSLVITFFRKLGTHRTLIKLLELNRVITNIGATVIYIFIVFCQPDTVGVGFGFLFVFIACNLFIAIPIGYIIGRITIWWISHIYNDLVIETIISFSLAFISYYIAKVCMPMLPIVGAVTFVTYVMVLNSHRDVYSVDVDMFFQRFVEILAYISKATLFTIAGFLITNKDFTTLEHPMEWFDFPMVLAFFCYSMFCRGISVAIMWPLLRHCTPSLRWQEMATMVVCDLAGPISIIMPMICQFPPRISLFWNKQYIQYRVLFYLYTFVVLKSIIIGSPMPIILSWLGLKRVSLARHRAMSNAVLYFRNIIETSIKTFKSDRFLADADWEIVYEFINFDDVYKDGAMFHHRSILDSAMSPDTDLVELEEFRLRLLDACRRNFWKQYEHGMLSLDAVRILVERVDIAEQQCGQLEDYRNVEYVEKHYQLGRTLPLLNKIKEKFQVIDDNESKVLRRRCASFCTTSVRSSIFDQVTSSFLRNAVVIIGIVTVILSTIELIMECVCTSEDSLFSAEHYFNLMFVVIGTLYLAAKLYILRLEFRRFLECILFIIIIVVGWIDEILHLTLVNLETADIHCEREATAASTVHKVFLALRIARILLLFVSIVKLLFEFSARHMQRQLHLGYDLGKGCITCEDEIFNSVNSLTNNPALIENMRAMIVEKRDRIMSGMAKLQKQHPGIVASVKSQNAGRRILSQVQEDVYQMRKEGHVSSREVTMLEKMVKYRCKKLWSMPPVISLPTIDKTVSRLKWVDGDSRIVEFIKFNSTMINMAEGEFLEIDNDPSIGLFVIVSGLIQVDLVVNEMSPYGNQKAAVRQGSFVNVSSRVVEFPDYMTTGCTFGEMALLTGEPYRRRGVCQTTVLLCHIPYDSIRSALDLFTEHPSLEQRLWQMCAAHVSLPLLKGLPSYRSISVEDMKPLIELGSLDVHYLEPPPGDKDITETIDLTSLMYNDIVLVWGVAHTDDASETLIGPCLVSQRLNNLTFMPADADMFVLYVIPHITQIAGGLLRSGSISERGTFLSHSQEQSQPIAGSLQRRSGRQTSVETAILLPKTQPGHTRGRASEPTSGTPRQPVFRRFLRSFQSAISTRDRRQSSSHVVQPSVVSIAHSSNSSTGTAVDKSRASAAARDAHVTETKPGGNQTPSTTTAATTNGASDQPHETTDNDGRDHIVSGTETNAEISLMLNISDSHVSDVKTDNFNEQVRPSYVDKAYTRIPSPEVNVTLNQRTTDGEPTPAPSVATSEPPATRSKPSSQASPRQSTS